MCKAYFLFGLVIFLLIESGLTLNCYNCYGKSCVHINNNTKITPCGDYLDENATEIFCIYVKYRIIDDIEQADRFCSNEPCSVVETKPIYKIGSKCEQCKTNLCNKNLGVNTQSWSPSIIVAFTVLKFMLS